MESKDALVVFEGKKVRRTWNNSEWWFVLDDIVYILTESTDSKQYIQKMKQRDEPLAKGIEKRVRGIAIGDELTGEWDKRGIKTKNEYSILTSEISKAAGEASTTKIARNKDALGFDENKDAAKEGGTVAGIAIKKKLMRR